MNIDYLGISNNNLCPPYPDCISYIGTQDTSECSEECAITGDVNNDGEVNVLDIVDVVGCVLGNPCPNCSDVNEDGGLDVLDIVMMVNIILES